MKRVYFSDNGTLTNISTELSNYHSGTATINFNVNQDAIYIGSELPFNSLYFDLSVVNTNEVVPAVSYWDGSTWQTMVDVIDETDGFGQSGYMTWTTDKESSWHREDTDDMTGEDLASVTVYDLFWIKITFSATLTATTALNWVGAKFCEDADLTGEHPLFGNSTFRGNYESGKTSWEKEIILATRIMIRDIIDKNLIITEDQLLDRRIFLDACVSKTAELIFTNLGDDYENDRDNARLEYKARMPKRSIKADKNANARLDDSEKGVQVGGLHR